MSNSPAQKVNIGLIDVVIGQRVFEVSFNTKTVSGKYLTDRQDKQGKLNHRLLGFSGFTHQSSPVIT